MIHTHDVNQKVAELVRQARADAGMTQAELAAKAAISRASVANIEIGIQSINVYQLLSLAAALGVPADRLLPSTEDFVSTDDPESRRLLAAYEAVLSSE
jgi:transcriptional regulator with XRE-family HTH domain